MAEALDLFRSEALEGASHGFLGRRGGVSTGALASLNAGIGSGDDPRAVDENRRRAGAAVMAGAPIVGVRQIHSPVCVTVNAPWSDGERPEADALVTALPGVLLAIVTADCAPVLLVDARAGVVGAAHAGWRGALAGVTEATLAAMEGLGARRERIAAAIGPCIAGASYEVDAAFRDRFVEDEPRSARHFAGGRPGHWQFDLEAHVAGRLDSAGVPRVGRLRLDTFADDARFFSYRRATRLGEAGYGRQISLIGLR